MEPIWWNAFRLYICFLKTRGYLTVVFSSRPESESGFGSAILTVKCWMVSDKRNPAFASFVSQTETFTTIPSKPHSAKPCIYQTPTVQNLYSNPVLTITTFCRIHHYSCSNYRAVKGIRSTFNIQTGVATNKKYKARSHCVTRSKSQH